MPSMCQCCGERLNNEPINCPKCGSSRVYKLSPDTPTDHRANQLALQAKRRMDRNPLGDEAAGKADQEEGKDD